MLQVVLGQDGDIINDEMKKFNLSDNDKTYLKSSKQYTLDFVGFVIEKEKMLAVFPKHFFDDNNIKTKDEKEIQENVKILFNVINKYNLETKTKSNADKYIGHEDNFESDYPFEAFFKIYNYYKRYGIYQEEEDLISKNDTGRVSWKKTIQKANVVVSNGNLIFLPIYSKRKNLKNVFISECMTFVINYTIEKFSYFIQLAPVIGKKCKMDFLFYRDYTLSQLYKYRNTIFKDYQRELVDSLIDFFEQYNKRANGGSIHFKIHYFEHIWEAMVHKYLNDCFVGVDTENYKLNFEYSKRHNITKFKKEKFNIDISDNKFYMQPDHYYSDENTMYVFDSKYYMNLSDLNYKQVAYTILLGNSKKALNKNLYSALLLPGSNRSGLHLKLDSEYCQLNPGCNYIIEQFLSVQLLMKNYLNY